jgi:outer membrane protein assembly factor BamB
MSTPADRQDQIREGAPPPADQHNQIREGPPPPSAPAPRKTNKVFVAVILALIGIFAFLTLYKMIEIPFVDADRAAKLAKAKLAAAPAGTAIDWPQWRGPNRDGISSGPGPGLLTAWPKDGPKVLWKKEVGKGYASIVVANGRAYSIFQEDKENEAVVCWDANSGVELWHFRYPSYFKDRTGMGGDGPRSTPCIDGDRIYTVGGLGAMHCLKTHPKTDKGEVVWKKLLIDDFKAEIPRWGVCFSPLVAGDFVYINPGGEDGNSLAALNKFTGAVQWKTGSDPAAYSSPVAATLAGRPQVVFFTAAGLVGVTPDKGEILWDYPWTTESDVNAATPIIVDDYIFISSGYKRGCALIAIEADAGGGKLQAQRVYQNKKMNSHFSTPVFYQDHLYGFDDNGLRCLAFRDQADILWNFASRSDQGGFSKGTLLVADGHLVILGEHGKLAIASASPAKYEELASFQLTDQKCWTAPSLANGRLYVRDMNHLWCLDVRKPNKDDK